MEGAGVRGVPAGAAFCSLGIVGGRDAAENPGSYSVHLAEHMHLDGSFEGVVEVGELVAVKVAQEEPDYKDFHSIGLGDLVNLVTK